MAAPIEAKSFVGAVDQGTSSTRFLVSSLNSFYYHVKCTF